VNNSTEEEAVMEESKATIASRSGETDSREAVVVEENRCETF